MVGTVHHRDLAGTFVATLQCCNTCREGGNSLTVNS
jgi:hypothetical protein